MKKLFVTLAFAGIAASSFGGAGNVYFSNIKDVTHTARIYGVDSTDSTKQAVGNSADYSNRGKLTGTGFTAELWIGTSEADLHAVAKSQVTFALAPLPGKTDLTGTFLKGGISKVDVDIGGGHAAVVQVRAWDNAGGTVNTWADLLKNDNLARGKSKLVNYNVAGIDDDGNPTSPAKNLVDAGLESFGLYIVPEPSVVALGALGLGALLLRRRK
ncbi:MAG: PEP-CTERM sorting domain-containing protein [Verrucomicrobia bacterium]|nr:PEP-CTERM sorting domain-containing protein [Verrucomicrobiota bacterium]